MYEFLKALFGENQDGQPVALTYDQLVEKLSASKDIKLVNLADGGYVSKDKFDARETELSGVKQQLAEANAAIKSYKEMDIDGIKKSAADWEEKYKTDTAALNKKLSDQERSHQEDMFFAGYKFSSKAAAAGVRAEFQRKNFPFQDGAFTGAKEWMESLSKDADYRAAFASAKPDDGADNSGSGEPAKPKFTSPNQQRPMQKPKKGLAALMKQKNDNPDAKITFD